MKPRVTFESVRRMALAFPGAEEANPETFFITDHYRAYPAMLVRVATATPDEMRDRLEASFRRVAPKKLLAALDAPRPA